MKQEFEYIACAPPSGQVKKLAVLFHGYGVNARAMQKMADALQGEMPDMQVVMPHAPEIFSLPDNDGENALQIPQQLLQDGAVNYNTARQWFHIGYATLEEYHEPLYALATRLNSFIDDLCDIYHLADKDIAIMGFSQGGAVATYTALLRDSSVGALVAHSTVFFGGTSLKSNMPALFIYGDADEEFDLRVYEQVIDTLRRFIPELETAKIKGLTHKTSDESRKAAAGFIKKHLG